MAFARPKPDANGEFIRQRYTELSDVIRARNKHEDCLLNVRLKFYERERNIRINIIRKEQYQLERIRTSLFEQTKKIQFDKQKSTLPLWMSHRPKSEGQLLPPEFLVTDFELNSNLIQPSNNMITTTDIIRRHSTQ